MKKIVVSIVGFGMSGQTFHLPVLLKNPNYVVRSIVTRDPIKQALIKDNYPGIRIARSFDEVLEDNMVSLVIIATSNEFHQDFTRKAILAGKNVVCEKPFVETYEEAKALFDLAKEHNVLLRVFHNRKYDGDILTVEDLLKKEDFGKLLSFTARFDRYVPVIRDNWRYQKAFMSGIYYDLAPHLVHHIVRLFGAPKKVYAHLFMDRELSVVNDHFELILYYEDGFTCYASSSMLTRNPLPKLELIGRNLTYSKYGYDPIEVVLEPFKQQAYPKTKNSFLFEAFEVKKEIPVFIGKHYEYYNQLYKDIKSIPDKDEDEDLALMVVRVIERGLESYHQGKEIEY